MTTVEGAVVLDKPAPDAGGRHLLRSAAGGHLMFMKNQDVPGVIGHVGGVLGRNGINIANFSLGRQEGPSNGGASLEAVCVIETDDTVPDKVLVELLKNQAVKMARSCHVEFLS